jgi:hypothetical protein
MSEDGWIKPPRNRDKRTKIRVRKLYYAGNHLEGRPFVDNQKGQWTVLIPKPGQLGKYHFNRYPDWETAHNTAFTISDAAHRGAFWR